MQTRATTVEQVNIYRIRLDLPDAEVSSCREWLTTVEQQRASRFLSANKCREFTVTRASLRRILAQTIGTDPSCINIAHEQHGRPYLSNYGQADGIQFSVTHSFDQAMIAVTQGRQIGVDIERVRADIDHEGLSRRFFSPSEYEALQHYSELNRLRAFFAVWTRKEAVVKAHGEGIALGLKQFDVSVDPDLPPSVLATRWDRTDIPEWSLFNLQSDAPYFASLAVSGGDISIHYHNFC